jgi:outer membrane lipoprotein-sorting protein
MKLFFSTLAFSVFSFTLSMAQPPKGMGKSDADAKKILDEVSAKFKAYKSVKASFSLKIENGAGKSMGNKTGTVSMKGVKYRISANGQDIFCDGSNIWTYEKASNEVTISKIDPTANSITPQKLFTNFYDKDFLYKLNGPVKMNGKNTQEIELTPVDKSKPFFKVLLYVSKGTIVTTKVFEKTGSKFTYSVSNMKTDDKTMGDDVFIFDAKKYPGVEVVDLR